MNNEIVRAVCQHDNISPRTALAARRMPREQEPVGLRQLLAVARWAPRFDASRGGGRCDSAD